jgi:ABC-type phosphate/phosphonate transport system permease subunit
MALSKNQKTVIVGLVVALVFVFVGVLIFSYSMETLDKQAEQLGAQENPVFEPPFPDYLITGLDDVSGGILIGIIGTVVVFALSFAAAKVLSKKKANKQ